MIIEKVWGSERVIVNNSLYCGKIMQLKQGWQCSLHHHRIKDETFHILSGTVWFERDYCCFQMRASDTIHIPPYVKHRFGGITDATMIEFSTPHCDEDVYRDEESRQRDRPQNQS